MGKTLRVLLVAVAVGILLPVVPTFLGSVQPASAANGNDFNAGYIMSDEIFYNSGTMSAPDIQAFLNQREPSCAAGYTCLKDYSQGTPEKSASSGCAAFSAQGNLSAAQIIQMVAQSCGINPRVLLTTLEKEQGLVSSTAPSAGRYRIAMGFGCPDTAACDSTYYGFFNQVYSAARQFKVYQLYPNSFGYRAGRVNTIQWSPNSCGSSQVYIQNQATAGLYNYTPYRPNQAALNNLYGTGDVCSSYGNRNFWRMYTDWFGSSTVSSSLVRSPESLQIWLVSAGSKYPINNPDIYYAYSASLGTVATVTATYLAALPTGGELGRFIGDSAGNLYLVDSGKRFHFDSYGRVADYGFPSTSWVALSDYVVAALKDGGQLTNAVVDASGNFWRVRSGIRTQAIDLAALRDAGESAPLTAMSDAGLSALRLGPPILRADVVVQQAGVQKYWLNSAGSVQLLPADIYKNTKLSTSLPAYSLTAGSAAELAATGTVTGVIKGASSGSYLMTNSGNVLIGSSANIGVTPTVVSNAVLSAMPMLSGSLSSPAFLRGQDTPTVYSVVSGEKHAVYSPDDLAWLAGQSPNKTVYVVPQSTADSVPVGGDFVRPGTIIKSANSPAAYLLDGGNTIHYITSYNVPAQLGFGNQARVVSDSTFGAFTKSQQPLSRLVSCAGQQYLGVDGALLRVSTEVARSYAFGSPVALESTTCARARITDRALEPFVRDDSGAVYFVTAGQRRWVSSFELLTQLGGSGSAITDMSDLSINDFSMGMPLMGTDTATTPNFIRASGAAALYLVRGGKLSYVSTSSDYAYASRGLADSSTTIIPTKVLGQLPMGPKYIHPGSLVRGNDSVRVYLVDGASKLIYLASFDPATALGASVVIEVPASELTSYTQNLTAPLTSTLSCGNQSYIGLGGQLYSIVPSGMGPFGNPSATLVDASTCAALPQTSGEPGKFISAPDGSVYLMDAGVRHHVRSPAGFIGLGGDWARLIKVSAYTISQFPAGSDVG